MKQFQRIRDCLHLTRLDRIILSPISGALEDDVGREAIILALQENVKVTFTFNNKLYIVDPHVLPQCIKEEKI